MYFKTIMKNGNECNCYSIQNKTNSTDQQKKNGNDRITKYNPIYPYFKNEPIIKIKIYEDFKENDSIDNQE